MTVATQMQQTIANCQSVLANLNTFALETEDQNVKKMYQTMAQQQQVILDNLDARFSYIKAEEPQYNE